MPRSERVPQESEPAIDPNQPYLDEFAYQLSLRELPVELSTEWQSILTDALNQPTIRSTAARQRQLTGIMSGLDAGHYHRRSFPDYPSDRLPQSVAEARRGLAGLLEHFDSGSTLPLIREYLKAIEGSGNFKQYGAESRRTTKEYERLSTATDQLTTVDEFITLERAIDAFLTDIARRYYYLRTGREPGTTQPDLQP